MLFAVALNWFFVEILGLFGCIRNVDQAILDLSTRQFRLLHKRVRENLALWGGDDLRNHGRFPCRARDATQSATQFADLLSLTQDKEPKTLLLRDLMAKIRTILEE